MNAATLTGMTDAELDEYYTSEACAHLALHLHRSHGWPLAILWDNETVDDWGEGPEPSPWHVVVLAPGDGDDDIVDVRGRRSMQDMRADFESDMVDPEVDYAVSESEVLALCGPTRPFYSNDEGEQQLAAKTAQQLGLGD